MAKAAMSAGKGPRQLRRALSNGTELPPAVTSDPPSRHLVSGPGREVLPHSAEGPGRAPAPPGSRASPRHRLPHPRLGRRGGRVSSSGEGRRFAGVLRVLALLPASCGRARAPRPPDKRPPHRAGPALVLRVRCRELRSLHTRLKEP